MMGSLKELLARVEALTGPDRETDAAIVAWLNDASVKPYPPATDFGPHDHWQFWSLDGKHFLGSEAKFKVPPLTSSLEAAIALVEKRLPGWRGDIDISPFEPGDKCGARLFPPDKITNVAGEGTTPPLAILVALLRAEIARSDQGGGNA